MLVILQKNRVGESESIAVAYGLRKKIYYWIMKRIVIMGATSGIGLRSSEIFAKAGWLVGVAGRNETALSELKAAYPENIRSARIDVNSPDASSELLRLIDELGGMDIYFHVSGIYSESEDLIAERETAVAETNTVGFTRMVDAAFNYFKSHGGRGRIAAVTSVAGTKGIGVLAAYSASKKYQQAYLSALSQLARIKNLDISVTDIRPGWIHTPLLDPDKVYPMAMSTDYAVVRIVRAIIERRRVCVVDFRWNLLVKAWRLLPDCIWERIPLHVSTKP